MFTPKELQEKTFDRAFRGYDMQMVDEFLEPLTEDYITLYKENNVLKSKLKVLIEKLEEYRQQEIALKKALMSAQETSDSIIAEAQKKAAAIVNEAEASVSGKAASLEEEYAAEQLRVDRAKATASAFIAAIESNVRSHLDQLERIKHLNDTVVTDRVPAAEPSILKEAPVRAAEPEAVPEEAPVEEVVPVEAPVEEAVPVEAPVEEAVPEEAPVEEAVSEEAPVEEAVPEEEPVEEAVPEEEPVEEAVTEEAQEAAAEPDDTDDFAAVAEAIAAAAQAATAPAEAPAEPAQTSSVSFDDDDDDDLEVGAAPRAPKSTFRFEDLQFGKDFTFGKE